MRVTEAMLVLQQAIKSSYDEPTARAAISVALNELVRHCPMLTSKTGTVSTVDTVGTVDVVGTLTDFTAERIMSARIGWKYVDVVNFDAIRDKSDGSTATGKPTMMAFETLENGTAYLWPTPDDAYTIKVVYSAPLVDVMIGNPEINIRDEYVMPALWYGASAIVEHNHPSQAYQSAAWRIFQDQIIRDIRGRLAPQRVQVRKPLEEY
jgi:hypothetical protein